MGIGVTSDYSKKEVQRKRVKVATENLYYGEDALSTQPVMHYQGTTYLCY